MFKSVFHKYVTAFMLIIVISFLVVLIITATAIGRFSNSVKQDAVMNTIETTQNYFSSLLYSSDAENLYELDERERTETANILNNISLNVQDVSTIVVDNDGKVVFYYYCEGTDMAFKGDMPAQMMSELASSGEYFDVGEFTYQKEADNKKIKK